MAELAQYTRRELDFRREARTSERLRQLFAGDDRIVIPAVISDRSSERVLTTEFLAGLPPEPAAVMRRGVHPEAVLRAGAAAMLRQVSEFGLFHADPHPGNVLFLPGDRIGFVDFGMFGRLDPSERRRMAFLFWALADGDYEAVGGQLLRLSEFLPGADPARLSAARADTVEDWFGGSAADFSITRLLLSELALGARYGIVFPRGLMLLARALVNLEATAMIVDPQLNLAELLTACPSCGTSCGQVPRRYNSTGTGTASNTSIWPPSCPPCCPKRSPACADSPSGPVSSPAASQSPARRWLPLTGAFAAGACLAALARKRRRA